VLEYIDRELPHISQRYNILRDEKFLKKRLARVSRIGLKSVCKRVAKQPVKAKD
jgi:hypothetical protein